MKFSTAGAALCAGLLNTACFELPGQACGFNPSLCADAGDDDRTTTLAFGAGIIQADASARYEIAGLTPNTPFDLVVEVFDGEADVRVDGAPSGTVLFTAHVTAQPGQGSIARTTLLPTEGERYTATVEVDGRVSYTIELRDPADDDEDP